MTMVNAYDGGGAGLDAREAALIARRERVMGGAYRLFYRHPVEVVSARDVWLYGPGGEAYLDAYNNVVSVGHGHPHVARRIAEQAARLNTHTRYLNEEVVAFAERLVARFPAELSTMTFTCTGSEANDLALRVAKACTGGEGFIVTRNAYHGVTDAVARLSPSLGPAVLRNAAVHLVDAPPAGETDAAAAGANFAVGVRRALAEMARQGVRPAALIVDTVFSSDGLIVDPAGFLAGAVDAVRAAGGLFVADEVQAGFGRTGPQLWGFARHGVLPDMVSLGKPMGNGYPVAALVARPELLATFGRQSRYFNTFAGGPVACAAADAVLEVLEAEALPRHAATLGASLRAELEDLARRTDRLGAIRAAGLYLAVDVVDGDRQPDGATAAALVDGLRERRVLISATGTAGNVLKIRPPLTFREEHAERLLSALRETLDDRAVPAAPS